MRDSSDGPIYEIRVLPALQALGTAGGFAVGAGGLFADKISDLALAILLVVATAFAILGFVASRMLDAAARRLMVEKDDIATQLQTIRGRFEPLQATSILRAVARPLFVDGGWRLTVYVLEPITPGQWMLRRVSRVSSSPRWEASGRPDFELENSFFRTMDEADLTSSDAPYFDESGNLPDPSAQYDEWAMLQAQVLGDLRSVEALTMRSRKYAWCAARESDGEGRVIALMAESLAPSGIATDLLRTRLTPALLAMIAKLAEAQSDLADAVNESSRALGLEVP